MLKKIVKNPFVWAFIIGIASLYLVKNLALMRRSAPEPMVIVPDWNLTNQNNITFGSENLRGRLVIASFFFTSCPTICPRLTNSMKEVHKRFVGREKFIEFISITVDPEVDTPEILKNYMKKNNISFPNWHCLTGSREQIYEVVVNNMKVHMGEKQAINGAPDSYDIPHLAHLALFDQQGNLRGLFKTEPVELAALVRAANFLLEKPPS